MSNSGPHDCIECGFHNDDETQFCASCGINLRERCPKCGGGVRARQNFCRTCGQQFLTARLGQPAVPIPEHLAKRISPGHREASIATVLMANIVNWIEVVEEMDAEESKRFLGSTIEIMMDTVHRYDGIIVRDRDDGILASFGAPVALEDHAVRACYAALDMQEAIRAHAAEVARNHGLPLEVSVGINSGPIVVTVQYEASRVGEIRVDGVPIRVAARLERLATPGKILLGHDALALVDGFVQVRDMGTRLLKGIEQPVKISQLEGMNAGKRTRAPVGRGLTKFVGHQREIETLRRSAGQALSGRGQVVALVGEAGVGKSRVFMEFLDSSAMEEWLVLEAGSISYDRAAPYLPLVEILTRYFDIHS